MVSAALCCEQSLLTARRRLRMTSWLCHPEPRRGDTCTCMHTCPEPHMVPMVFREVRGVQVRITEAIRWDSRL